MGWRAAPVQLLQRTAALLPRTLWVPPVAQPSLPLGNHGVAAPAGVSGDLASGAPGQVAAQVAVGGAQAAQLADLIAAVRAQSEQMAAIMRLMQVLLGTRGMGAVMDGCDGTRGNAAACGLGSGGVAAP